MSQKLPASQPKASLHAPDAGVGFGVGEAVGVAVGLGVGAGEGVAVGLGVGTGVGKGVGLVVGDGVGLGVGEAVGAPACRPYCIVMLATSTDKEIPVKPVDSSAATSSTA